MRSRCDATLLTAVRRRGRRVRCLKPRGHEHTGPARRRMHRGCYGNGGAVEWADTAAGATPSTATAWRVRLAEAAR